MIVPAVFALAGLILLAAPLAAESPEKPLIAVLPFQPVEASETAAQSATALVETALVNSKAFTVVSQADRDRVLQAQEAALAECADEECAIRIGKLLQATRIVVGNVVGLGKKLILNAKIIDINTAEIIGADTTSAAGVEGLEEACRRLAQSLVESSQPGMKPEGARAAAAAAPAIQEPEQASPETTPKEEKAPKVTKPPKKKPAKAAAGPQASARDPRAFWLTMGGVLALGVGNVASTMSYELLLQGDESFRRYIEASTGLDALFKEYRQDYTAYLGLGITSFTGWGLGASAVVTSLFLFPRETYGLSRFGRIIFTSGLSLTLVADVLSLMAGNQSLTNIGLYNRYLSATTNLDSLFAEYKSGYALYSVSRILSYSFWALGGAAMVGAFFLPGERAPVISGPLDRWLTAAGVVLIAGGSLAQSMALHARRLSDERFDAYLNATANLDQLYADYRAAYTGYTVSSVLAYSFWALGGAGILTALFVTPSGAGKDRAKSEPAAAALILPTRDGLTFLVSLYPKELHP